MARSGRLKLVVFDMAGTTVDDVVAGVPLVLKSYDDAFRGTGGVFRFLRGHGIGVALNTGFPRVVAEGILGHLGWEREALIDSWTCSEEVGKSRPDPAMIHALMGRLGVEDPSEVMKIDDTAKGIEEGLNAGAVTLGVLTGTQTRERLLQAKPHGILESVRDLPDYLEVMSYI